MNRPTRCLLLPLIFAACGAAEEAPPTEEKPIEGRWLAKVRIGEASFLQDTLELLAGGGGKAHRLEYTLRQVEGGGVDSSVKDFGAKAITWQIRVDETGRNLCVSGQNGPEEDCGPLTVVSDSVINLGNFPYRMLPAPTAAAAPSAPAQP